MLVPADSFYTELTEGYVLRLVDSSLLGKPEATKDVHLDNVESVIMKNIVQKQFVVQWRTNEGERRAAAIEMADQSDRFFIALNFIHEKIK